MFEFDMYYGAPPEILKKATTLRKNMTKTEEILWEFLRKKKVTGLRFSPQHPIYLFIADFYCHSLMLVIEVDGGYHKTKDQMQYDIGRTAELNKFEIQVIRFSNDQVENDLANIKQAIIKACVTRKQEIEVKEYTDNVL